MCAPTRRGNPIQGKFDPLRSVFFTDEDGRTEFTGKQQVISRWTILSGFWRRIQNQFTGNRLAAEPRLIASLEYVRISIEVCEVREICLEIFRRANSKASAGE